LNVVALQNIGDKVVTLDVSQEENNSVIQCRIKMIDAVVLHSISDRTFVSIGSGLSNLLIEIAKVWQYFEDVRPASVSLRCRVNAITRR